MIPKPVMPMPRRRHINPLSPIGLTLISFGIFFISTIVPPSIYETIMREPNAIFLNPVAYLFFATCVLSFLAGALIASRLIFSRRKPKQYYLSRTAIVIPVALAALVNLLSVSILLKNNPSMMTAWLFEASTFKETLDTNEGLSEALPLLFAVSWWSFWRLLEKESIARKKDWTLRLVVGVAFIFATATSLLKVARYDLLPGVFGFLLIYYVFKSKDNPLPLRRHIAFLTQSGIILSGLFVAFSYLRSNKTPSDLINNIAGYTVASYNRFAYVLSGDIVFPYGGTGFYALTFLSHIPLLSRFIDLGSALGIPSSTKSSPSEALAIFRAGLDGKYNWVSSFGYLYLDIGLFCFIYLLMIGMLMRVLWGGIINGRPAGIILYPWFAFCVLFWFGSNYLVYPRIITLTFAALLFSIYEPMYRGLSRLADNR